MRIDFTHFCFKDHLSHKMSHVQGLHNFGSVISRNKLSGIYAVDTISIMKSSGESGVRKSHQQVTYVLRPSEYSSKNSTSVVIRRLARTLLNGTAKRKSPSSSLREREHGNERM